ncbi:hypothetical protein [Deinococcus cellulosilyticus]|uniref:hypothetical protein n=1 Tax=Deinococcus cellulosilyticus TaxID=401558 RepID=UPI0011BDFE5F|nr:hypothetical protein [Deinococcus cellulosilyticus]
MKTVLCQFSPLRQITMCVHEVVFVQWDHTQVQLLRSQFEQIQRTLSAFEQPEVFLSPELELSPTPQGIRVWFRQGGMLIQQRDWETFSQLFQRGSLVLHETVSPSPRFLS